MGPDEFRMWQMLGQGGGLYGNVTSPYSNPFGNSSFFGNNPMLGAAAQMILPNVFGQQGMFFGQFAPQQNLYDQFRAQQYQVEQMRALTVASQGDKQTYLRMARGIAHMTHTPFGVEQMRAANTMAGDMAAVMPFLAPMAPDLFDQLHGVRGSQTVMSMMLQRGGYSAIDPVTGLSGLSGASSGVMAKEVWNRLYGPNADLSAMKGFGAGSAGAIYAELQNHGMAGQSIGTMSRPDQAKALGISLKDMDAMASPRLDEARRQFDSRQVADRIKNLAGAVSAMRDIFGDMGKPDAPMAELINGLNNLTQGGLATMSAGRLETTVRKTYELAKQTGIGMQAMYGLTAQGAVEAQKFGIDPGFGIHATQGAAAFGAAYGDVGGAQYAAFGRMDKDKYTIADQKLRIAAAASGQANQLGALFRYANEVGNLQGPAKALMDAVKAGRDTFSFNGTERSTYLNPNEVLQIMGASGISSQVAASFLRDHGANQAYVFQNNLGGYVREHAQGQEVQRYMQMHFQGQTAGVLGSLGVGAERARLLADRAGNAMSQAALGLDASVYTDANKRTAALAKAVQDSIGGDVKLTDEQAKQIASLGWGQIEEGARSGQMRGYGSGIAMLDLHNHKTIEQAKHREAQARIDAEMGKALSGLGRAGPLARLADMLQSPPGSMSEALGKFLGGVPVADIEKQIAGLAPQEVGAASGLQKMVMGIRAMTETQNAFQTAKAKGASPEALQQFSDETNALISGNTENVERSIRAILKHEGMSVHELDNVLAGNHPKVSEATRMRLRGLVAMRGKGLSGTAETEGIAVGAKVGENDLTDVRTHGAHLNTLLKKGALSDKEKKDARRYAELSLGGGGSAASLILSDTATLKAAGKGAFEKAKGIRESLTRMRALAAEKGGGRTLEELLVDGDPKDAAVKQAREMYADYQKQVADLHAGFGSKKIDEKEVTEATEWREKHAGDNESQLKQNREILQAALKASGGHLSAEAMEKLAQQMGTGEQGDIARQRLQDAVKSRQTYAAEKAGHGELGKPKSKAEMDKLREAQGLFGNIGTGAEGTSEAVTNQNLMEFIKEGQKPADDTGKKGRMDWTGEFILKDPHNIIVKAHSQGGTGSTPVTP